MKTLIFLLIIASTCFSQQPNVNGAFQHLHDIPTNIQAGTNYLLGPHMFQLSAQAGYFNLWEYGYQGQPFYVFVSGALSVGAAHLPEAIVDLAFPVVLAFTGTTPYFGSPQSIGGIAIPVSYDSVSSWSVAAQTLVLDPTSAQGYSLSSALFVWR
jgi:hypothetical protein